MQSIEKDRAALTWFTAAWDDYINNLQVLLPVALALTVISSGSFYILDRWHSFYATLPYMLLVVTPVTIGANLVYIKTARNGGARLADLFSAFPVYNRALAVSLGLGLATACGALLLVVPGVILYLTFIFSEYAVVDLRTGIKESFKLSSRITYGWKTRLFPVFSLALLINVAAPDIFSITGSLLKDPVVHLNLKLWTVAAAALKTLVFLPWLSLALARAYNLLLALPAEQPQADA
jgi:hypothetical protein